MSDIFKVKSNNQWIGLNAMVGPQGPQGIQGIQGPAGQDGADGTPAGFGTPTATASALQPGASPTVSVTASGQDTAKVFNFSFGIPSAGVYQADWNESDTSAADYIKNKPDLSLKEDKSNKVTSISSSSTDTQYPSAKCVYDSLDNKLNNTVYRPSGGNTKATWISSVVIEDDDTSIPTCNAVNISFDSKLATEIATALDALDCSNPGALGKYISAVSQANGTVSASATSFDTTVGPSTGTGAATDDNAPTSLAVRTAIDTLSSSLATVATSGSYSDLSNTPDLTLKEDVSNKVTSISSSSTDTEYPSAKCVYDAIQAGGGGSGNVSSYIISGVNPINVDATGMNIGDLRLYSVYIAGSSSYGSLTIIFSVDSGRYAYGSTTYGTYEHYNGTNVTSISYVKSATTSNGNYYQISLLRIA